MKRFAVLLLSLAAAVPLGATAQIPDVLTMNGITHELNTNPLAPFLDANPGRMPEPEVVSTGLWRGYIATWAVRDKRLYLEDVKVPTAKWADSDAPESEQFRSAMQALFGEPGPRIATWFTGNLIIPTGELVSYVHMGYGSTYSEYIILTIVGGDVRKRRDMSERNFDRFRRSQWEAFKKTAEYEKLRAQAKETEDSTPDELLEQFLYQYTSEEYLSRIFEKPRR